MFDDLSPNQGGLVFYRADSGSFSLTFQEYVIRYRIFQACTELRHPNVGVANVAYSVGFNDPSYFARVFRRYIGCSPTEYSAAAAKHEGETRLEDIAEKLELTGLESGSVDRRRHDRRMTNINDLRR